MYSKEYLEIVERRKHDRFKCEASIEWSYFNAGAYFNAKLLNFSRGGVFIESDHDITLGATIIIRLKKVLSSKIESGDLEYPRLVSLGEVTWLSKFHEKHKSFYSAGVRYPITA